MGIFRVDTTRILEANDPESAASKLGLKRNERRITDITKYISQLQDMGDLEVLKEKSSRNGSVGYSQTH